MFKSSIFNIISSSLRRGILFFAIPVVCENSYAAEHMDGVYAAIRLGSVETSKKAEDLVGPLSAALPAGSVITASGDDSDFGGMLALGYQLNKNVALEVFYAFLGDYNINIGGQAPPPVTVNAASIRKTVFERGYSGGDGFGLSAKISGPIAVGSPINFELRPGVVFVNRDLKFTDQTGSYEESRSDVFGLIGFGLSYPWKDVELGIGLNIFPNSSESVTNPYLSLNYKLGSVFAR
jgi:hypothetical protein